MRTKRPGKQTLYVRGMKEAMKFKEITGSANKPKALLTTPKIFEASECNCLSPTKHVSRRYQIFPIIRLSEFDVPIIHFVFDGFTLISQLLHYSSIYSKSQLKSSATLRRNNRLMKTVESFSVIVRIVRCNTENISSKQIGQQVPRTPPCGTIWDYLAWVCEIRQAADALIVGLCPN